MIERTIFYITSEPKPALCVLKPGGGDTGFHRFEIGIAAMSRLALEIAPHLHRALAIESDDPR